MARCCRLGQCSKSAAIWVQRTNAVDRANLGPQGDIRRRSPGRAGSNQDRPCPAFTGMTTIDSPASWKNAQLFPAVRAISPESANSSTRQHRSTIERA